MQPSPRERMRGWRWESQSQFLVDIGWTLFENLGPTQCDSCFVNPYKQKRSFLCLRSFEFLSLAPELILINTQCAARCCPWFLETATFNKVSSMLLIFFSLCIWATRLSCGFVTDFSEQSLTSCYSDWESPTPYHTPHSSSLWLPYSTWLNQELQLILWRLYQPYL